MMSQERNAIVLIVIGGLGAATAGCGCIVRNGGQGLTQLVRDHCRQFAEHAVARQMRDFAL